MLKNIVLQSDSYKAGHEKLYKDGTQNIYSYMESRGGKFEKTVFFGLQYYLKRYLEGVVVTKEKIDQAEKFWSAHFGRNDYFNREHWDYIVESHGGKLPVLIKALPEGSLVRTGNALITIEATDKNCFWLPNFLETMLMKVWYPSTVATQSYNIRQTILDSLKKTGTPELIDFKCHDFGYRGCTSEESAALGAAAHLLSFQGTDTVAGIILLQEYYNDGMAGFSVAATEHSNICSFGRDAELDAYKQYLDKFPTGIIACVSDTYDIYNACENLWGGHLKSQVLDREGVTVIRPDSGDYFQVVPKVLDILAKQFGFYFNSKGFKVLNDKVRVIQGDGMNPETIKLLYTHLEEMGWSADNLAVGSGGGLLVEGLSRDTSKYAFKASAAKINGEWIDVFKDPITDPNKKSKRGRLKVVFENGEYKTVRESEPGVDCLVPVFENGNLLVEYSLETIKNRLHNQKGNND